MLTKQDTDGRHSTPTGEQEEGKKPAASEDPRLALTERLDLGQQRQFAGAVSELIDRHTKTIEQRQVQIGQRRAFRELDVASALNAGRRAACHQHRDVMVHVAVAVGHARTVEITEFSSTELPSPSSWSGGGRGDARTT